MGGTGSKVANNSTVTIRDCILWKTDRSPPCRAVLMVLNALNMKVKQVDVCQQDELEEKKPEVLIGLSMNPLQTVPILKDKNVILYESHAICTYLASLKENSENMLPREIGARALVDQLLFYNSGTLFPQYRAAMYPIVTGKTSYVLPFHIAQIENSYQELDVMLGSRMWFGGPKPNLADICIAATVSTLNVLKPIDDAKYPRLSTWMYQISGQDFYMACNTPDLSDFPKIIVDPKRTEKRIQEVPESQT